MTPAPQFKITPALPDIVTIFSLPLQFSCRLPPTSLSKPYAMPHHDGLPLVFQFPEEDTQPESQEHKVLWDELEPALWEDAAPVPAPVAPTAPAPIPVALMGWEPHIVAELYATGFHEAPPKFTRPCTYQRRRLHVH